MIKLFKSISRAFEVESNCGSVQNSCRANLTSSGNITAALSEVGFNAALGFLFVFFRRAWESAGNVSTFDDAKIIHVFRVVQTTM